MANFFIDRPIFAWVIAIVVMLAGALAISTLPVQRYPTVAPPSVEIRASYPGASAETLSNTVTQVIEQSMTGLGNLIYMASSSDSSGHVRITLTFKSGTDPDIAQVHVQNKLERAKPRLPKEVLNLGLQVIKANQSFLMVMNVTSPDGSLDRAGLNDLIASKLQDPIARVKGVGTTQLFGSEYAMRIWLNPNKLARYKLTVQDVVNALQVQNDQVTAGSLGAPPAVPGQQLTATITAQTRLHSVDQFKKILLKTRSDGSKVTLADVARVELGGENYAIQVKLDGQIASGLGINLSPGANALATATRIHKKVDQLKQYLPAGTKLYFPYETAPFVASAIHEVYKTLIEAIILVFLVMLLFLQSFRATLIPTIAVPVVLLGTFGIMAAAGFSINMLTMFGMILAIGLLVDDAIVVVENVERLMDEEGLGPREAAHRSMHQITGALVGIGVVLTAVFVPMAFFPGSTGVIYRQFSLTLVAAMVLSVLTALVFTPALCATLLKKPTEGDDKRGLKRYMGWFNRGVDRSTQGYLKSIHHMGGRPWRYALVYLAIVVVLGVLLFQVPTGFLPKEDQGVLLAQVQLPPGATMSRTEKTMKKTREFFMNQDAVEHFISIIGFGFGGRGQNVGIGFINLKPWDQRTTQAESVPGLLARSQKAFSKILDGRVFAFNLPTVHALGNATGFSLMLEDRAKLGHEALAHARDKLLAMAREDPVLTNVRLNGQRDNPQYKLDIDHEKARALGLSLTTINQTLSVAWGGSYINDFVKEGRVKRVYLQAAAPYRMLPKDIDDWYLRNDAGELVPLGAIASGHWTYGSPRLESYNGVPSMNILGEAAPGYSSGEAMQEMEKLVGKLKTGIGYEWTALSYQEVQSGNQAPFLYALSLLVVFLALAALYESWSIPVSVILIVPLGVIGAVLATMLRGLNNDVFFQVAILTTIGLAAKNSILVVEFAKDLQAEGYKLMDATIEAARIRLRPILMTSMAFCLGVLPLAISSGAGAAARIEIGTAVLGGMLSSTFIAIFFIPLFYLMVRRMVGDEQREREQADAAIGHES